MIRVKNMILISFTPILTALACWLIWISVV